MQLFNPQPVALKATQTVTAGSGIAIDPARVVMQVVPITAAGITTITATPTIAAGYNGQWIKVINVGSNAITIQDAGLLPGSLLELTGVTIALTQNDNLDLMYLDAIGAWVQVGVVVTV